jgi:hypothetical protein
VSHLFFKAFFFFWGGGGVRMIFFAFVCSLACTIAYLKRFIYLIILLICLPGVYLRCINYVSYSTLLERSVYADDAR